MLNPFPSRRDQGPGEFKVRIKTPESKPQITTPDFKVQRFIENLAIKNP